MGRPKKEKLTVTMAATEVKVIADRLGYKTIQDFMDDLAMGLIPPPADSTVPPSELPIVEDSGRSMEVAQPKSSVISEVLKRKSWAVEVEEAEAAEKLVSEPFLSEKVLNLPVETMNAADEVATVEDGVGNTNLVQVEGAHENSPPVEDGKVTAKPKSWSDVVSGNASYGNSISVEYIQLDSDVVHITDEEWVEGAQIWKFPVLVQVVSIKPSYMEMFRWVTLNWGKLNPRVSQLKAGLFVVDFTTEEERLEVLRKN